MSLLQGPWIEIVAEFLTLREKRSVFPVLNREFLAKTENASCYRTSELCLESKSIEHADSLPSICTCSQIFAAKKSNLIQQCKSATAYQTLVQHIKSSSLHSLVIVEYRMTSGHSLLSAMNALQVNAKSTSLRKLSVCLFHLDNVMVFDDDNSPSNRDHAMIGAKYHSVDWNMVLFACTGLVDLEISWPMPLFANFLQENPFLQLPWMLSRFSFHSLLYSRVGHLQLLFDSISKSLQSHAWTNLDSLKFTAFALQYILPLLGSHQVLRRYSGLGQQHEQLAVPRYELSSLVSLSCLESLELEDAMDDNTFLFLIDMLPNCSSLKELTIEMLPFVQATKADAFLAALERRIDTLQRLSIKDPPCTIWNRLHFFRNLVYLKLMPRLDHHEQPILIDLPRSCWPRLVHLEINYLFHSSIHPILNAAPALERLYWACRADISDMVIHVASIMSPRIVDFRVCTALTSKQWNLKNFKNMHATLFVSTQILVLPRTDAQTRIWLFSKMRNGVVTTIGEVHRDAIAANKSIIVNNGNNRQERRALHTALSCLPRLRIIPRRWLCVKSMNSSRIIKPCGENTKCYHYRSWEDPSTRCCNVTILDHDALLRLCT